MAWRFCVRNLTLARISTHKKKLEPKFRRYEFGDRGRWYKVPCKAVVCDNYAPVHFSIFEFRNLATDDAEQASPISMKNARS
jgi:hypothetical protein